MAHVNELHAIFFYEHMMVYLVVETPGLLYYDSAADFYRGSAETIARENLRLV